MAFEDKHFADGETTFNPPKWRQEIEQLKNNIGKQTFSKNKDRTQFSENEIGFRHPTNGSFIRITEEGDIEAFTAYGTGFRLSAGNSFQVFGDRVQIATRKLEFQTSPNGAQWNESGLKEDVYASYPKMKGITVETLEKIKQSGIETYGAEDWK